MKKILLSLVVGLVVLSAGYVQAATETYQLDPAHTNLGFKIKHLGISWVSGSFKKFEGTVVVDTDTPANSKIKVTVEANSVDTGNTKRDTHLNSPDFFDTAKFPTLSFESTKLTDKGQGVFEVEGNFTLHGVTKPVTITLNTAGPAAMQGQTRRGGDTEFTIKRSDYGMDKMVGPVGDEVKISLSFEAIKQ
ncbi:MAG: YceI family protein [Verrucomicrobiales bacterium]|jgi:polyisoprenoid-binding protein YceI|nr:YceI family protein [Verrucomicrobiales bacterium]